MVPFIEEDYLIKAIHHFSKCSCYANKEEKKKSWIIRMIKKIEKRCIKTRSKNYFSGIEKKLIPALELMFQQEFNSNEMVSVSKHHCYVKIFLMMYLYYINASVISQIHDALGSGNVKIGYVISIEKMLSKKVVGTKENIRDLLLASGIISNSDDSNKAQIITHGEGYLSVIQTNLNMKLPDKSYYVLAQLHEEYIQLTLQQVVQVTTLKEKDVSSIIIQDEIIPIQNIYNSLCMSIWNHIVKRNSLIKSCPLHNNSKLKNQYLFSIESFKQFMTHMKRYLLKNVSLKYLI